MYKMSKRISRSKEKGKESIIKEEKVKKTIRRTPIRRKFSEAFREAVRDSFTEEEIEGFEGIILNNGTKLVSKENIGLLYELISLIEISNDKEQIYNLIVEEIPNYKDPYEFIWQTNLFDDARYEASAQIYYATEAIEVARGGVECTCGSEQVFYSAVQTRRSDEPPTIFYECTSCGRKWHVNG
jgi:DNA-directed RNA polymerase, subunit M/Transcription elongation factor TFIIS